VGAVILGERHNIISIGYNGTAPSRTGCLDGGCPRGRHDTSEIAPGGNYSDPTSQAYCIATHAEMNALVRAKHEALYGATMYVTNEPCNDCAKIIGNTPIHRIIFIDKDGKQHSRLV